MSKRAALLLIAPVGVFFILSFLWPMVMVVRLSLFKTGPQPWVFVGFSNYIEAVKDVYFQKSFANSLILTGMIVPFLLAGSYKISSMLSDFDEKVQSAVRFAVYIPGLTAGLIMALLWAWILNKKGLLNQIIGMIGLQAIPWLSEVWPARVGMALISILSGMGGYVIMFAVTMHAVPVELKDAARIDGASNAQYKRHIVLPMMMPMVLLSILMAITGSMQIWETLYVLFGRGGPEGSMASPVYEMFMTAFYFGKQGLGSAKGIILLFVIAGIMVIKQSIEKALNK